MSDQLNALQKYGYKTEAVVDAEDCEMLRALYDFKATIEQTLDFSRNDHFILHSSSNKERNWWHVVNSEGRIGYIPSNYVEIIHASPKCVIGFLNKCITLLQRELSSTESGGGKRQQLLKELTERRRRIEGGMRSPIPPRPPTRGLSSSPSISPCDFSSTATPTKTLKKSATAQSISTTIVKQPVRISMSDSTNCCTPAAAALLTPSINNRVKDKTLDDNDKIINSDYDNSRDDVNVGTVAVTTGCSKVCSNEERATVKQPDVNTSNNVVENNHNNLSTVTETDVYRLVNQVRRHTELAFELSRVAVGVVITDLMDILPSSSSATLTTMIEMLKGDLNPPEHLLDETHDACRLRTVLSELVTCKEDAQQRSWELYEDESTISEYLKELISILNDADSAICRRLLSRDKFRDVSDLLEYYQMEVRWSIRKLLLEAFSSMCSLHSTVITLFLNSILPMELARDMQSSAKDVTRLINSANLLAMIFCMGEPMPVTHLEHIGCDFISFVLNMMEEPPETDNHEQIPDMFFRLILSYNLQFTILSTDNVVVQALAKRNSAKTLTEKILFTLNREEDPARVFDHEPKPVNSTIKLITDMFACSKAADLFYTNDINVLIDIIVRQLTDLSPGDDKRTKYLELCRLVLRNTNYSENQHRCSDLHKCFTRIFCEESSLSNKDQLLVREISNEFPQYFKA
ncbi:NCK-interacting protein with SH3 domain [Lycorma delicatula]|uniref:NCK-interacting protein with SH3 domain n=1 Tax=Lycorma delicatula TaxID=130591 RepID=UPI003F50F8FD